MKCWSGVKKVIVNLILWKINQTQPKEEKAALYCIIITIDQDQEYWACVGIINPNEQIYQKYEFCYFSGLRAYIVLEDSSLLCWSCNFRDRRQ